MSKQIRFVTRFVVLGAVLGTLGAYSSYAMRQSRALPAAPTTIAKALEYQVPNRAAKANRLAKLVPVALTGEPIGSYSLASIAPAAEIGPPSQAVMPLSLRTSEATAEPAIEPQVQAKAEATPAKLDTKPSTRLAALPPAPEAKAKRLPAPPQSSGALLDDSQIAGLRSRLRLTAEQMEYWPAVEAALRDVARTQLRGPHLKHVHGKPSIDVNSAEVQKLIYAAMPLLGMLREEQKSEVRKLARIIGLDQVASQI